MTIQIACTCDGGYAPHTGTMLQSLLAANLGHTFVIHVLHQSLAGEEQARLRRVVEPFGARLAFVRVPDTLMQPLPQAKFHRSCWHRIFLPDLLPGLEKILYLDSDIVVVDDVGPLWATDVSAHPFGAVTNPLYPFLPYAPVEPLGLKGRASYINSGVLLMNLTHMRRERLTARVVEYARQHPDNPYPEQDALSALFGDKCLQLHPRWNVQTTFYDLPTRDLPFDREVVRETLRNPAIVHFIGPFKPWVYLCTHPLRHLYFAARAKTPWPVEPPIGRTLKAMLLRPLPLIWRHRLVQAKQRARALIHD